jgi:Flp pilus assembly protein TadG
MRARRPLSDEKGTSLVEFALILPLLLLILFGVLDFGKAFNYWNDETHLAAEGARWAVVNGNPGGATLQQYIREQADSAELRDNLQVCVDYPNGATVGNPVTVTLKHNYNWIAFLSAAKPGGGLTLPTTITGSATMRLEAIPDSAYIPPGSGGTGDC